MKAELTKNRKGMTLLEVLIAAGLLCLVLLCTVAILNTTLNMWAKGSSGTGANSHACLAMRKLVQEIEEGQSASVAGNSLVVAFPYYNTSAGYYERTGTGNTVTYFLSGSTGNESSGTYLWKSIGTNKTQLAENIEELEFDVMNGTLVRIRLKGTDAAGGAVTPSTVRHRVRLRNG